MTDLNPYLQISPEVAAALHDGRPVVALESTIISHGMPYPQNTETALRVEAEVRKAGAIPATVAVLNGKMKAGLSPAEIEVIGKTGAAVTKVSRRDLPVILARRLPGATTVAATMIIAAAAGIPVFATGGIGGVHRGAERTMDISADLQELARTNVAVVSAGVKSILDLELTLEYLETMGVLVIGYQTEELPAFFVRDSGFTVDYRTNSPAEIAQIIRAKRAAGLHGGMLIANPVPAQYQADKKVINAAIEQALAEAGQKGIKGKAITPFLLQRIEQITGGHSLESNIRLVLNNARLGAEIAVRLAG